MQALSFKERIYINLYVRQVYIYINHAKSQPVTNYHSIIRHMSGLLTLGSSGTYIQYVPAYLKNQTFGKY